MLALRANLCSAGDAQPAPKPPVAPTALAVAAESLRNSRRGIRDFSFESGVVI
jgi:hypothetical protein